MHYSVGNSSAQLRRFFGSMLSRRKPAETDPTTRYTFRRNLASIMEIRIFYVKSTLASFWHVTA